MFSFLIHFVIDSKKARLPLCHIVSHAREEVCLIKQKTIYFKRLI